MIDSFLDVVVLLTGYLAATFGAGWVVGRLIAAPKEAPPRLPLAWGLRVPVLIGWLERFLIVTFVLLGELTAVGFIILAKTVVRFGETSEDRQYAEYVLCGTLVSFCAGLALGLLIKHLLAVC